MCFKTAQSSCCEAVLKHSLHMLVSMRLAKAAGFMLQITDNPILFQPLEEDIIRKATGGANVNLDWIQEEGEVTTENAGQRLSTRCERETLSRFPKTQAILFTIRTHIRTLDHYAQHPERVCNRLPTLMPIYMYICR